MDISILKAQQTCSKKNKNKKLLVGEGGDFYILFSKYIFTFSYFIQKYMVCYLRKKGRNRWQRKWRKRREGDLISPSEEWNFKD